MKELLQNCLRGFLLCLVLSIHSSFLFAQSISKSETSPVPATVCPVATTHYSLNLPSGFENCTGSWTVENGTIESSTGQSVAVVWNDTPGAIAKLTCTLGNCSNIAKNGIVITRNELILSIKEQAWGSYGNSINIDFCTIVQVNLTVPRMFVQGTGGVAQPQLTEVIYGWTVPSGWWQVNTHKTGFFGTINHFISIEPMPNTCSKPGSVTVVGLLNDASFCPQGASSKTATITLSGTQPTSVTVTPQGGFNGVTLCNRTPVTFYATPNVLVGCENYVWTYPPSWTSPSQSGNAITLTPSGTSDDSNPISVKVNYSCGSTLTSPNYIPPFLPPTISGPNPLCTSATFTVANPPPVGTITWSSNVLSINATTGFASRVNYFHGQGTITATISGACVPVPPVTRTQIVGTPYYQTGSSTLCNDRVSTVFYYSNSPLPYTWEVFDSSNELVDGGAGTSYSAYGGQLGPGTFKLKAGNTSCTPYANWRQTTIKVVYCSSFAGLKLNAYPNPATSSLTVEVTDNLSTKDKKGKDMDEQYYLSIVDKSSQQVYSIQSTEKKIQIPTNELSPGMYYLIWQYKDVVMKRQIMIKK